MNLFSTNKLLILIDEIPRSTSVVDPDERHEGPEQRPGVAHHLQAEADHLAGVGLRLLGSEPVDQAQLTRSHQQQEKTDN